MKHDSDAESNVLPGAGTDGSRPAEPVLTVSETKPRRAARAQAPHFWAPIWSQTGRLHLGVLVVVLVSLFVPLGWAGIWDPHELEVAELSRRVAIHVFGAQGLSVIGADNSAVTQGVLGRGELPFTSVALGFMAFGLHDWAARLPLALWGLVGVVATYGLLCRLADRRTATFGAAVLATLPLYFCHSRTLLGEAVSFAALAMAGSGLAVALFDTRRLWVRATALALGLLGLGAGFLSRGLLVGVAVPLLGVGFAWAARFLGGVPGAGRGRWCANDAMGLAAVLAGLGIAGLGARQLVLAMEHPETYNLWLGFSVRRPETLPTFDLELGRLGHALFPWSALLPWAFGQILRRSAVEGSGERERDLRLVLLSCAVVGYSMHVLLAPLADGLGFTALFAVAGVVAVAFRDYERGAPVSLAGSFVVAATAVLLWLDFRNAPGTNMEVFSVDGTEFPASFGRVSTLGLGAVLGAFTVLSFFPLADEPRPNVSTFQVQSYLAWPRALAKIWRGNALFILVASEVALVGTAALAVAAARLPQLRPYGVPANSLSLLGWMVPLAIVVLPPFALVARDAMGELVARLGCSRAAFVWALGVGLSLALSVFYFPALSTQLSPKQVFRAYAERSQPNEPLALLNMNATTASYYAGRAVPSFDVSPDGFHWLVQDAARRWLVVRKKDLAQLNAFYRAQWSAGKARNLPVLDATSSEILLTSNHLKPGEQNHNPLEAWIPFVRPRPARSLDVELDGLAVLGWEIRRPDGRVVDEIAPGQVYQFCIYLEVKELPAGTWQAFIHIDGYRRRHNGDHDVVQGQYPSYLWRAGDFIADVHEFSLEPNFGAGVYSVYFGLFAGSQRLEVKRGPHDQNRIDAGKLRVR